MVEGYPEDESYNPISDDLINGVPVQLGDIGNAVMSIIEGVDPGTGVVLDPETGLLTVSPQASNGTYTFIYGLCSKGYDNDFCETPDYTTVTVNILDINLDVQKIATILNEDSDDSKVTDEDRIQYTFIVTNNGEVDLYGITIDDPLVNVPGRIDLAAGASDSTTFFAIYDITEADVLKGNVENIATATGEDENGNEVTDESYDPNDEEGNTTDKDLDGDFDFPTFVRDVVAYLPPDLGDIYNGVTPNGDGKNETFVVQNIRYFPKNNIQIFNRWGAKVYEKDSYNNEFNGYSDGDVTIGRGEKLPEGTYYYVLSYTNEEINETNTVSGYIYLTR